MENTGGSTERIQQLEPEFVISHIPTAAPSCSSSPEDLYLRLEDPLMKHTFRGGPEPGAGGGGPEPGAEPGAGQVMSVRVRLRGPEDFSHFPENTTRINNCSEAAGPTEFPEFFYLFLLIRLGAGPELRAGSETQAQM